MARDRAFWLTALAVAGIVLFAFFVRTYWNIEAATPGETFVLSESDAYYIHHSVERIQQEGWSHPIEDPLVNYPVGGINPNPPLWEWWIATWGALLTPFFAGDAGNHAVACPADVAPSQAVCVSTWWVTVSSPALFGALTVLLVVLIGREMWGWRAGLLAGFLAATSTSHIERSVLGFADHDSFVLFFIVLGFYFFIKSLHAAREHRWVERWGDMASVRSGLAAYVRANQLSLAYAAMAGVAIAGVGLAWKGYAYAAGTVLAFGLFQLLVSHWRNRDATHIYLPITVALFVAVLVSAPYYANPALGAVLDTLLPVLFILIAWIAIGLVFTATRDLPFVLVLPAAVAAGLVGLAVAFVAAPSVATSLLAPLVYFKQTKLYTTIAEAHPADFNSVVFGTGFVGFFIALFALPYMVWTNRKAWRPAWTFVAIWALIAMYMTQSAVRFMFNATPVFALLGGWGTGLIVARLRFETIGKNLAGLGGFSRDALRRAVNVWHVIGIVLLALLLVTPNVMLAVDAGMPAQYEDKLIRDELEAKGLPDTAQNRQETFVGTRFGAFGQGFISDYWRVLFEWLATQDTSEDPEKRPGFLSWWDYGHWALSLGRHPAVADNFQNGFQFAGNFIAAQNETHAVQLFLGRLHEAHHQAGGSSEPFLAALTAQGLGAEQASQALDAMTNYIGETSSHGWTPLLTLPQSVDALRRVEAATDEQIRYFAVDVRLFPYDNPQTPDIDFGSIFYAPITLSDHDPDDFVELIVKTSTRIGGKTEFTQEEFAAAQRDPRILPQLSNAQLTQEYRYKEPFFNSMFFRTYIGTPVGTGAIPPTSCDVPPVDYAQQGSTIPGLTGQSLPGLPMPGFCMQHFRLVYYSPQVRMVKFYPGAVLEGEVLVDGKPLEGARVVVFDDAGDLLYQDAQGLLTDQYKGSFEAQYGRPIAPRDFDVPHAQAVTDAQGKYRLLAPFSTTGQVTVRAFKDDAQLGNRSFPVTVEQAEQGAVLDASLGRIESRSGSLEGKVFYDTDRNNRFSEADIPLQGARVQLLTATGEATTDANGSYRIPDVPPGTHQVRATLADYEMRQRAEDTRATVEPGEPSAFDVAMQLRKASVTGQLWRDANDDGQPSEGEGVSGVNTKASVDFRQAANTALQETYITRDANGTVGFNATPGRYVYSGQWRDPADARDYAFGTLLDVGKGQDSLALPANATRLRAATLATLNLTLDQDGNLTPAGSAQALLVPTQGGAPSAERLATNGTLAIPLVAGTYQVFAQLQSEGATYTLDPPGTLVVQDGVPASFAGTLRRS